MTLLVWRSLDLFKYAIVPQMLWYVPKRIIIFFTVKGSKVYKGKEEFVMMGK